MKNFPFYIARRYLVSRKSTNVINIISGISIVGVTVGTMALIVILSVFNGLDVLIKSLFSSFDSDIRITLAEGKTFCPDSASFSKVRNLPGVINYSEVLEENALCKFGNKEYVATVKGVDTNFSNMTGLDTMLVEGKMLLHGKDGDFALAGYGVAAALSLNLDMLDPIAVYVPRRGRIASLNAESAINSEMIRPSGIFSVQQEIDSKYMIVPIGFMRKLLEYTGEVTAVELKLAKGADREEIQKKLSDILGNKFLVRNRYQQHELIYKTVKSEKLMGFIILAFILFIASFNIIGSLTMLIIDKKRDIETLRSLGADMKSIREIFLFEGWMISVAGAVAGLLLGAVLCYAQEKIGLIPLSGKGTFIVKFYPVEMQIKDFAMVFFTVLTIGFLAAWYPVRFITRRYLRN
ncbi:MAG: FtsX-like permease family protein [Bacteroidia bacterium]|nr:FtsX-like permease family protein [Bacteroidia bacterium]